MSRTAWARYPLAQAVENARDVFSKREFKIIMIFTLAWVEVLTRLKLFNQKKEENCEIVPLSWLPFIYLAIQPVLYKMLLYLKKKMFIVNALLKVTFSARLFESSS